LPSFVFKWLKASSATGYLRSAANPNKRQQDGYKRYWLCSECETLFCGWETEFANKVFHPFIQDGSRSLEYEKWMLKFCVSVSWRALSVSLEDGTLANFSAAQMDAARKALAQWAGFLRGLEENPGRYEQHFLPTGLLGNVSGKNLPLNLNRYMLRNADMTPAFGKDDAFIYTKLERFIIVGFIEIRSPKQWVGTKVHVRAGRVCQGFNVPFTFANFLLERCRIGATVKAEISERQKDKIAKSIRANSDRLLSSETFAALHQDVQLFGTDKVFK
jgi:hypothetical protein